MKESGINWAYSTLALPTGAFGVYYTFEAGAGTNIPSVSGGQSGFSGTLSSATNFWPKAGSGYSSGTSISINNASGLDTETWTKIFVYEKVDVNDCVLFDSLIGGSGHRIGLTKANKLYFESFNGEPITASFDNNLSSKNVVAVSYLTNLVTFGLFNFNAQVLESQSFTYPFQVTRSDAQTLGGQFTGWWDQYIHLTQYQSPEVIGQLCSGFFARPTGIGFAIDTVCTTGVTGYQNVVVGQTGITGYSMTVGGDQGRDYYTGAFPLFHMTTPMTGYLSSGLYSSGVSGSVCYPVTGDPTILLEYLTGYASSFGMQKVQLFTPLISTDLVKSSWDLTPFNDIYNRVGQPSYSGFLIAQEYPTDLLNLYLNGIGQAGSGWSVTGTYLFVTGTSISDVATFDLKSGDKKSYPVAGGQTGFLFPFSGQEIYLNGVNQISGYDYVVTGSLVNLTARATGINGDIFEYPIVLTPRTGNSTLVTGGPFSRSTSNEYLNGVRQQLGSLYIEGGTYDLLSGNQFTYSGVTPIYGDDNLYWEH